jgi:NADPH-dependent glutamate synthase beta subunit-like oxidoreductase/ferredoxin/Flp pilus assembly protein TadD
MGSASALLPDLTADPSNRCLVLAAEPEPWQTVLRAAVSIASAPDGRSLRPVRRNPQDVDALLADDTLDLLEHGAAVVADLPGVEPDVFALLSWTARLRPRSVLLLRRGHEALPVELHEFGVRTYELDTPEQASASRVELAGHVLEAARARSLQARGRHDPTTIAGARSLRRRRARNGVDAYLRAAARAVVRGETDAAVAALVSALDAEPHAVDLLVRLGVLHRLAGRWASALPALERAVEADPLHAPAWRELGIVRQKTGASGAQEALTKAVDLADDYEATLTLALARGRSGDAAGSTKLLEHAMKAAGGQPNLVLPALVMRCARDGRVSVSPWERERVEEVLAIRAGQADGDPPEDAPWCFFDTARAQILLGNEAAARRTVERAAANLSAPWQAETFGESLSAFERGGVDVAPLRELLGLDAAPRETPAEEETRPTPPFRVAARDAGWFVHNVPCMAACPVGTDAGAYVQLLSERRFEDAFRVARGPNPFASVCARICAAPCEDACRRGALDAPVEIRSLKRFLTQRHGVEGVDQRMDEVLDGTPAPCIEGEAYASHLKKLGGGGGGRRVAVVGGGPAGLACAHDLALLGHQVTLLEASHQLGGMMRQGIPIYRLSRDLLELEIGAILSLGVRVDLGRGLDGERTLETLFAEGQDAVFLASGAGRGRHLEVEGSQLDGVVRAIDFLLNANAGYRMDMGRRVVVVGGGNVAIDVARTARLGRAPDRTSHGVVREEARAAFGPALSGDALRSALRGRRRAVHVLARQPMGEWPAQRTVRGCEEVEFAREEGVVFHPLRGVRRFVGANGRVTGVELAEVVQLHDEQGRYAPRYGAHLAETLACDTVFLAVGQEAALDYLRGTTAVHRTRRGLIEVDRETLATSMPGVYAGGDAAFGPRTVIEAVADGKRAARSIHRHLATGSRLQVHFRFEAIHPRSACAAPDYDTIPRESPPCTAVGRRTGISEVEGVYDDDQAVRQAQRCLACHVQTIYDGSLCIACGRCTDICPHACLSFVAPEDTHGDRVPGDVLMVKDEERCVRCGLCAERCPTGAMTLERFDTQVTGVPA